MPVTTPITPTESPGQATTTQLLLSTVTGAVTDQGDGAIAVGLGGKGLLAGAVTVRVSQLLAAGLKVVASAAVDASGKFDVKVPLGLDTLIAQVLDASGNVLGSVIVGASGKVSGDVTLAAPITTETSLEVAVLLDACRCPTATTGAHAGLSLAVDVTALVDAKLTAAIAAAIHAGVDVDVLVHALASAVVASARARADVLADAGVKIDANAALKADVDLLAHLNAGLTGVLAGKATVAQITAELLADLDAALSASADISASVRVRAQVAASLSFCATLVASLTGIAHVDAVVFAATHATAQIEANLTATVVTSLLKVLGSTQTVLDGAIAAGDKLVADVAAATNLPALTQARLDFVSALCGGVTGSGGLLGDLLVTTTGTVNALLGSVLDVVAKLCVDLDASLKADLSAFVKADVCLDVDASAKLDVNLQALIKTLAKFAADVQALGPSLQTGTTAQTTVDALTDLLATAQLTLRVGQ
jgi:hypothetical protein